MGAGRRCELGCLSGVFLTSPRRLRSGFAIAVERGPDINHRSPGLIRAIGHRVWWIRPRCQTGSAGTGGIVEAGGHDRIGPNRANNSAAAGVKGAI